MTYETRLAREIALLDPAMQHKVHQLLDRLELFYGENVLIVTDGGRRTEDRQDWLYAQGRTRPGAVVTNADGDNSLHVWGCAIDIAPVGPLGIPLHKQWKLEWAAGQRYETIASVAQAIGFEWGFQMWGWDKPHLQYTQGLTLADFKKGKRLNERQAKKERIDDVEHLIRIAERALRSPAVTENRKNQLRPRLAVLKRKWGRIE